jgi:hypothetical protein
MNRKLFAFAAAALCAALLSACSADGTFNGSGGGDGGGNGGGGNGSVACIVEGVCYDDAPSAAACTQEGGTVVSSCPN